MVLQYHEKVPPLKFLPLFVCLGCPTLSLIQAAKIFWFSKICLHQMCLHLYKQTVSLRCIVRQTVFLNF